MLPPPPPERNPERYTCMYCTVCMYSIRGICTVLYCMYVYYQRYMYCTVCMYIIRGICTVLCVCILSEVYVQYCMYV